MSSREIKRYDADELVRVRKVAGKVISRAKGDQPFNLDIRRVDSPKLDIKLRFQHPEIASALPGVPSSQRPSASLFWRNHRIRGIDWTIKHEVIWKGMPTGDAIHGWHEHYWTDEDGYASIRTPREDPGNVRLSRLIDWCFRNWNIELPATTMELFQ